MSEASKLRERAREKKFNRTKPTRGVLKRARTDYKPFPLDVTGFAQVANEANHTASKADLAAKHGRLGAFGNQRVSPKQRKLNRLARIANSRAKQAIKDNKTKQETKE